MANLTQGLGAIGTHAPIAARLVAAVNDVEIDMREIAATAELDPSLSLRLLRLANTMAFRGRNEIITVQDALVRLGRDVVLSVAASAAVGLESKQHSPPDFWEHVILLACAGQACAEANGVRASEGFAVGLLVDTGCALFHQHNPHGYRTLVSKGGGHGAARDRDEVAAFGVTHPAVGAHGLGELGLPEKLCNAIAYHHDPDSAEEDSPLVRVAADAVTVSDAIRLAGEDTDPHSDELADVSERVKMPADDLLTFVVANVEAARHFANG